MVGILLPWYPQDCGKKQKNWTDIEEPTNSTCEKELTKQRDDETLSDR
jgi:hypothetical protein